MKPFLIAAVAATASAAAIAGVASGQSSTPTTLKFVEKDAHFKFIDAKPLGQRKLTQGDQLAIGGKVKGGTTNLVCTVTKPGKKAQFACTGVLHTAAGDLTVTGISSSASHVDTFALTGGTGDYTGARGTVVSKDAKDGDHLTATFTTG